MRTHARGLPRIGAVAATLLALVLALTGCSTIPTSGEVHSSSVTAGAPQDQFIRVLARGPQAGATPEDVVKGFLAASASFDDGHAVARTFLTEQASAGWDPLTAVTVYEADEGYEIATIGPDRLRMLALNQAGTINARGEFAQPTGSPLFRADFTVAQVEGEWRISALRQGLILSTADVARAYRTLNLYFVDQPGAVLVPAAVALPAQTPGLSTRLVRDLLRGPTEWLAPAVRTGFPAGARLAVESVPIEDGVARVDLDPAVISATPEQRRMLAAQLTYTLTQLADVTAVRITIRGLPFAIPGIGSLSYVADWESFDPDAAPLDTAIYAVDADKLATVDDVTVPVEGYFGTTAGTGVLAVAPDGAFYAGAFADAGQQVVRIGVRSAATATDLLRSSGTITSLSFDRTGVLWVADSAGGGALWTGRRDSRPQRVKVEGLGNSVVETLRVSHDGVRVALVVRTPRDERRLLMARVVWKDGVATVSAPLRIESALKDVADVAWTDDSRLLLVASRDAEQLQSFTVGIDGNSLLATGTVPAIRTVAASPGRPFLAGTADQQVWADRGNGWRRFVTAQRPIYPG
jgi:hypothetical protein